VRTAAGAGAPETGTLARNPEQLALRPMLLGVTRPDLRQSRCRLTGIRDVCDMYGRRTLTRSRSIHLAS
jgi:hypothetical protein